MPNSNSETFQLVPHHLGISVPDLEKSIAWYRDMLGFSLEKRLTIEPISADIAFMKHGDFCIELFQVKDAAPLSEDRRYPDQDIRTHGTKHIAFAVSDVPKFIASLKQRGVDIAKDVSMMEGKPMAFIRDNAGNLLEIVEASSP